ncbi:heterokaryon incompatibility domain-containing protein [Trichoderma sp. SZMC 28012]
MLPHNLLPLLVDIVAAILVVGIFVAGYFSLDKSPFSQRSFPGSIFSLTRHYLTDPCRPHRDGGLPHGGCIRLVRINSTADADIVLSWSVFPLAAAPAYHALSYTWGFARGVPEHEDPVFRYKGQHGVPTSMPKNLFLALNRIIKLDEGVYYWIDSLCIDQENTRERSEQVAMMKEIYEHAAVVDVWLGPTTDSEAKALDLVLGDLSTMAQTYGTAWTPGANASRSLFVQYPQHLLSKDEWDTLIAFMSRRWFHRLWTLQEFALAKKIRILCGDHFINPDDLHNAALFLQTLGLTMELQYGNNGTAGTAVMQQSILRACLGDMNQLMKFVSQIPGVASGEHSVPDYESVLAWVFWRSANTYATDPRDFVYGILGLAEAIMERLSNMTNDVDSSISAYSPIVPDYSLSTADVFRAFILRLMHSKLGIRAVALITPGVQTGDRPGYTLQRRSVPSWVDVKHELPSWVPNLANREQFSLSNGGALFLNSSKSDFNIHGSALAVQTQRFYVNGNNLHVFGRRLGITRGSSRFPSALEWAPCATFLMNFFGPLSLLPSKYPIRCADKDLPSKPLSPVEVFLSCISLGSWQPGNKFTSLNGPSLPVWKVERFIVDGITQYLCVQLASAAANETVDHVLTQDTYDIISRAQSIKGIDEKYLYEVYKRFKIPLRILDKHDFLGCVRDMDEATDFSQTCSHLIRQFHWARGRVVFAIQLDDEYVRRFFACSGASDRQEVTKMLLGLGPEGMRKEDEVWAIEGSEWPFLLRPLYIDKERKLPVMDMSFEEKEGGWWSQTDEKPHPIKAYEFIGEVYVHGIMHGELFDHENDVSDFEEIVIR